MNRMNRMPRCTGSCFSGRHPCACPTGIINVAAHADQSTRRFFTWAGVVMLCLVVAFVTACGGNADQVGTGKTTTPAQCAASGVCA